MRTAILEINGHAVDLPASLKGVFRLQNAVAALQDLETRTGEYAWPLTLPFTRRNDAAFGQIRHAAALDKFTGAYTFRLQVGGQRWAGVFRLISLKNGYQGALAMDGFGWALALGEKKITELTSLPAIPYDGSQLESILAQNCDTTNVQFPLVSFGNFFSPPLQVRQTDNSLAEQPAPASALIDYPLSVDDYYPGCYYVNLVRAILREAGYFAQGPVLDEPDVRTWCVTAAGGDPDKWPWGALLPAAGSSTGTSQYSYFAAGPGTQYENTAIGFDEDRTGEISFLPLSAPLISSGGTRALDGAAATYTAPRAGVYGFSWSATVANAHQTLVNTDPNAVYPPATYAGLRAIGMGLVVRRGGAGWEGAHGGLCTTGQLDADQDRVVGVLKRLDQAGTLTLATGTFGSSIANLFLEAGDTVSACVFARRRLLDDQGGTDYERQELVVNFSATSFACTHYADNDGVSLTTLSPVALLPPLTQKELLRDFLVRTNALLVTDSERGTATLDFRPGHRAAQGPPVDLTGRLDPDNYEPLPVLGSAQSLVFGPADAGGDGLLALGADTVRVELGSAAAVAGTLKQVGGAFAAVAGRAYTLPGGQAATIPTAASPEALKTARSETSWDVSSAAPRVVRYLGLSPAGVLLPFQQRSVRFGRADYAGSLAWAGDAGAVAARYAETLDQARRGHRLRVPVLLTPARYRELAPGRRVWVGVAEYTVEQITGWDALDEAAAAQVEFLRVV